MLNAINDPIVQNAIKDPDRVYKTPQDVLDDAHLNTQEKKIILKNWELDQIALLRAEGENMPASGETKTAPELLQAIRKAKRALR